MVSDAAVGVDVSEEYLRWRLLVLVRGALEPVPARWLLRRLSPGLRPAGGSAAVDAVLELLATSGVPLSVVEAAGGALWWSWDPLADSSHFQAVDAFWNVICERAARGWRGRDPRPISWALRLAAGEMVDMEPPGR